MDAWINDKALDDIRRVDWHIFGIEGDATTPEPGPLPASWIA